MSCCSTSPPCSVRDGSQPPVTTERHPSACGLLRRYSSSFPAHLSSTSSHRVSLKKADYMRGQRRPLVISTVSSPVGHTGSTPSSTFLAFFLPAPPWPHTSW